MKSLFIGDLHLRASLGYSELFKDKRASEEKEVLDFIVDSSNHCDKVYFSGDLMNLRNNPSEINKKLVEFLERFDTKELFIISGNHDRGNNGATSLDFLKEIKGKNWHIITKGLETIDECDFLPYQIKSELGTKDSKEATKKIVKSLKGNKILFCHYALSGTKTISGGMVDMFDEIVLPVEKLKKDYKLIIAGHIHQPYLDKQVIVTGSVFNETVGEHSKSIFKVDEETLEIEEIKLPGRGIYKLEDPAEKDFNGIPLKSIVKVILTDKKIDKENIKEYLRKFDASIIVTQYPNERKKIIDTKEDILEMSVEKLLNLYAKQKKIPIEKLNRAFELIKL